MIITDEMVEKAWRASPCSYCKDTGIVAIRSRDGTYAFAGPVPDDAKGYIDADCWYCARVTGA